MSVSRRGGLDSFSYSLTPTLKTNEQTVLCENTVWFDKMKSIEAPALTISVTLNKLPRLRVCFLQKESKRRVVEFKLLLLEYLICLPPPFLL